MNTFQMFGKKIDTTVERVGNVLRNAEDWIRYWWKPLSWVGSCLLFLFPAVVVTVLSDPPTPLLIVVLWFFSGTMVGIVFTAILTGLKLPEIIKRVQGGLPF